MTRPSNAIVRLVFMRSCAAAIANRSCRSTPRTVSTARHAISRIPPRISIGWCRKAAAVPIIPTCDGGWMPGRIAVSMPAVGTDRGGSVKAHKIRTRLGTPLMLAMVGLVLSGCAPTLQAQEQPKTLADSTPMTDSPLGHYLAARQAQTVRQNSEAADFLAVTLAKDPDNPELLNVSYLLLASEGRLEEAAKVAEHIDKVEPNSPTAGI